MTVPTQEGKGEKSPKLTANLPVTCNQVKS